MKSHQLAGDDIIQPYFSPEYYNNLHQIVIYNNLLSEIQIPLLLISDCKTCRFFLIIVSLTECVELIKTFAIRPKNVIIDYN